MNELESIDRKLRQLDLDSARDGELVELLTRRGALLVELANQPATTETLERLQQSFEAGLDLSERLSHYRCRLASQRRVLAGYSLAL